MPIDTQFDQLTNEQRAEVLTAIFLCESLNHAGDFDSVTLAEFVHQLNHFRAG